jgi:hypothetical protein
MDHRASTGLLFDFEGEDGQLHADDHARQKVARRTGTFTDNMKLPVHRWFRYSAGFSGAWAEDVISKHSVAPDEYVFDPFVGSGTTLIAAQAARANVAGAENHSFVHRVAQAKLLWSTDAQEFQDAGAQLLRAAQMHLKSEPSTSSDLLLRCYTPGSLCRLEALKAAYLEAYSESGAVGQLLWLVITSILRECSYVGTAQWQYVLPQKSKARVQDPFAAFTARVKLFYADMHYMKAYRSSSQVKLEFCDARDLSGFSHLNGKVRLVLTSPPYPNNYDYADATRLEMTFWDEIGSWGDLQKVVRHRLVRSCSQHSAAERLTLEQLLIQPDIAPIGEELRDVCTQLEALRQTKGGKKTYHTMVAAYFLDLAQTWKALWPLCAQGADVCFVVGDSAPYGVYVPVERWLGELALSAGFKSYRFEKLRDRNVKWKNRKHTVPLKEGNLWVKN